MHTDLRTIVALLIRVLGLVLLWRFFSSFTVIGLQASPEEIQKVFGNMPQQFLYIDNISVCNAEQAHNLSSIFQGISAFVCIFFPRQLTSLLFKGL
jgi:hypothetical protein